MGNGKEERQKNKIQKTIINRILFGKMEARGYLASLGKRRKHPYRLKSFPWHHTISSDKGNQSRGHHFAPGKK